MAATKSLLNTPLDITPNMEVLVDGIKVPAHAGELLIEALNRNTRNRQSKPVPQVCYLPQMGPIESCDTCMVQIDGKLVRACSTRVVAGMNVVTEGTWST